MGEVLKVFISATTADLGGVRTAAKHALLTLGYFPVEQEHFGPAPETIMEMLRRRIGESDAVLHIVGECYGAEPPLDPTRPRRSYTQWEYHLARELKKPLYVFVCGDAFPYTAHAAESAGARELQRAHRAAVVAPGSNKYERIPDLAALDSRLREIQLELQRLRRRHGLVRRLATAAACLAALALALFGAHILRTTSQAPKASADSAREGAKEGVLAAESFDPARIKANLRKQIKARAAEEIARLDPVRDWEKVVEVEKARDQQLGDVDRAVEQIRQVFAKKEASANYAIATQLLAQNGVAETLRFLESNSEARETKIAALKGGLDLTKRAWTAQERELREALREKLLAASLLEKDSQWDKAEAEYRAVVRDGGTWPEPRNRLAGLLWQRGRIVEPAEGNRKLREAVELCRGTLAANPREADPKSWAATQTHLGNALSDQGERAAGAESQRLLDEAVTAYRAALEVYTREHLPQDWAMTQNDLGATLWDQGKRGEGEKSVRLLGEAVTAYRAALEVYTREQLPQGWAGTQNNLGNALWVQGSRAQGAESEVLLGEAVTAYRAALEVYTRQQLPQDWAMTQNNLGNALSAQGSRAAGDESLRLLRGAVAAYHAALEVYRREQLPLAWARTQDNLAMALRDQGTRAQGAESLRLLGEAVATHRAALEVYTREHLPQDWRDTQHNLALALRALAERSTGAEAARLTAEAEAIDKELAAQP
jgi:tetratricopeptide (TPR) repeat protein